VNALIVRFVKVGRRFARGSARRSYLPRRANYCHSDLGFNVRADINGINGHDVVGQHQLSTGPQLGKQWCPPARMSHRACGGAAPVRCHLSTAVRHRARVKTHQRPFLAEFADVVCTFVHSTRDHRRRIYNDKASI
jgi:hypothetical protein